MSFQKGAPRPPNAGRKKGSKNKRKIPKVAEFLADKDINPAEEILNILEDDARLDEGDQKLSKRMRIEIWMDLLSYCQAKPAAEKAPEDPGDEDDELDDISTDALLQIVKKSNEGS